MQTRVTTADPAVRATAVAVPEGAPALPPRISWGAVLAGAIVAVAVGTMLNVLGAAIGATSVDAQAHGTPHASTIGIAGGLWLLVSNLIGLAVGGYVAARLSGTADETDSLLHGLSVWGISYLISALLLGNIVAGTASTATQGIASVLGGVAQGAGSAAGAAAPAAANAAQGVDPRQLVERAQAALRSGGDPAAMSEDQRNAEMATLLGRRVTDGNLSQPDRDRLTALAAAQFNISREDATRRIQQVEEQATRARQEAERAARAAADAAASAAAVAAYWIFAAMLLGAVAAVLGSRTGTRNVVAVRRLA